MLVVALFREPCDLCPCLGILMLTVALFLTAGMGIIQEKTYGEFGKHPKESLFYNVRKRSFLLLIMTVTTLKFNFLVKQY